MNGRLGGLFLNGKQIGGFLDWNLDVTLSSHIEDKAKGFKLSRWQVTARSYWLDRPVSEVEVRLFSDNTKAYWRGQGRIDSPTKNIYGELIQEEFIVIGRGVLNASQ